jgi:hypothetical protein
MWQFYIMPKVHKTPFATFCWKLHWQLLRGSL